ncbi:hypothetical protein N7478_011073 [Penicillium angulare]|uniref:uncharacterized protein n=1 Tax=Penicillium angulare TaxID=116970 RepID=UPI002541D73C|nr:uncharacterized protein N7478_011073 [Penicillium angulare]KAJ5263468.1 hypothetical protein N7478_011073 [Penicillium angulare]
MHVIIRYIITLGILATVTCAADRSAMLRTVVTTDMEQDDLTSLIRFLLYSNELDTQGIIYSASRYHWSGDGNGTMFYLPGREYTTPQWQWRWTGTRTIQDKVLKAWAEVWPNLNNHDPHYPTPDELLSKIKIGNIDFEGEMSHDTEGSDLIRSLILDQDPRKIYLQAWGGTNTIARALKSIEEKYSKSGQWTKVKQEVSRKAVIMASGFQDDTYAKYIAPSWPDVRVESLDAGGATWGYNCNKGQGNTRGLSTGSRKYFSGDWIKRNVQTGPYGGMYRSWLDGQAMPGDRQDIFGDPATANTSSFCQPLSAYDFLSEGDNICFNNLLSTGLQNPESPRLGGWGGRAKQNSTSPNLWVSVDDGNEKNASGIDVADYTTDRWSAAVQNDFAARMQWTMTPDFRRANHPPSVQILNDTTVKAGPGSTVLLVAAVSDPDSSDKVTTSWWQFFEEGTYPGSVHMTEVGKRKVNVSVPKDAKQGQNISLILQGTDDGDFPLTRYSRIFIQVT